MLVDSYYPRGGKTEAIYWRYRDPNGNLVEGTDHAFNHYFYAPNIGEPTGLESIDGEPLFRRVLSTPSQVYDERAKYEKTWEADVPFTDRWLIDNQHTMPAWVPRKC